VAYIQDPDLLHLIGQLRHGELVGEAAVNVHHGLVRQPIEVVEAVEGRVRAIDDLERPVA
jgi:hypothetical protein